MMEIRMDLLDVIMIAGICLSVGACAFLIRAQLRSAKRAGAQDIHLENARRAERLDLYMGAVWTGFLVVQTTSIFHHVQLDGTFRFSLLSLSAFAAVVLICGGFAGRLLLRREMRLDKSKREERNAAART
jgi:hypothetical protein